MELRGGLEVGWRLGAKAGRGRREIECRRPALSSALTSCAVVSFVVKALSQRRTPSYSNQYVFRRSDAASNRDFEPGFEGPSGVRSLDLHVLRVPPPVSPRYGELSPCYGEIISLLLSCSACTANFPQAVVIKMNFSAKTGPETANSPCFLPVVREYQGGIGAATPSPTPASDAGTHCAIANFRQWEQ